MKSPSEMTSALSLRLARAKPPRILLDYVPASWLTLVEVELSKEEEEKSEPN